MPQHFIVIDTNILVRALITNQNESPTCQIVDGMLRGRFSFLLSLDLLAEYRTVLLRPKIKKLHALTEEEIDIIVTEITATGMVRHPPTVRIKGLDPGDQHVWDLVNFYPNTTLVTGDHALRKIALKHFSVLTPQEFVELPLK
jgi:putative PIN family toxin of toxin-antitoxin system